MTRLLTTHAMKSGNQAMVIPQLLETAYPAGWNGHHRKRVRIRARNSVTIMPMPKFIGVDGFGSVGNETTFFGSLTRSALARFQNDNDINPPKGYFGPITRTFLGL